MSWGSPVNFRLNQMILRGLGLFESYAALDDGPIAPAWREKADQRGFRIVGRIRDRYHLNLECKTCGAHTAVKLFALRGAQPRCGACVASRASQMGRGSYFFGAIQSTTNTPTSVRHAGTRCAVSSALSSGSRLARST